MTQKGASAYDNIDIVGVLVVIVGSVRLLQALSCSMRLGLTFFAVDEGALPGAALNSMTRTGDKQRTPKLEAQTQPKPHHVQNCLWEGRLSCISLWLHWNN